MSTINYIEKHTTTFTVKQHKHSYWEIIYVTAGNGTMETSDGYKLSYQKNDIICIPPELLHINYSSDGFRNIHLTIDDYFPQFNTPKLLQSTGMNKDFGTLISLAYHYFHLFSPEHPLNVSLSASIVSFLNTIVNQPTGNGYSLDIANEIIANFTDPYFDLEQAYKNIPQSKEYARKQFVKQYGFSPSRYLRLKRIELAKQLLLKNNYETRSIAEVAYSCGFLDVAYFSKIFKQETGVAPTCYKIDVSSPEKYHEEQ